MLQKRPVFSSGRLQIAQVWPGEPILVGAAGHAWDDDGGDGDARNDAHDFNQEKEYDDELTIILVMPVMLMTILLLQVVPLSILLLLIMMMVMMVLLPWPS